jgi:hypothetical protein
MFFYQIMNIYSEGHPDQWQPDVTLHFFNTEKEMEDCFHYQVASSYQYPTDSKRMQDMADRYNDAPLLSELPDQIDLPIYSKVIFGECQPFDCRAYKGFLA